MKAQDLRIGNYIEFDSSVRTLVREDEQGFIEVRSIGESGVNEWSDYGASGCVSNPKPIPLTKDWLVKFGFEKRYEDCFEYGKFILNDEFIMMDIDITIKCKHVHQLQNLYFALTGEELKING